jgi:hypothetical protein
MSPSSVFFPAGSMSIKNVFPPPNELKIAVAGSSGLPVSLHME